MKRFHPIGLLSLFTALILAAVAMAGVPRSINYQGYLKDGDGTPVNGEVPMAFALYSSATPRHNPVWSEPDKIVIVTNGIYSTRIGSEGTPLRAPFDVPYYLSVIIKGIELPLQPLSSVPYAQRSVAADSVADNSIDTNAIIDNSITSAKIANGAVMDANIGGTISAGKLDLSTVVNKAGDTMSGPLILPANGLAVGTNQLVASGGRIGIGTAAPNEQLEITGNLRLPTTTATTGIIRSGASTLIHTYGLSNFFAGVNAGNLSMSGSRNTVVGTNAFISNISGNTNTVMGYQALNHNTDGSANTVYGYYALYSNTDGAQNTAVGYGALQENESGNSNTAIGLYALRFNNIGSLNTAVGEIALKANFGSSNTAVGYGALEANTAGNLNTAIGQYANVGSSGLTNATVIGANALVSQSNSLVLGGTGAYAVKVGIGTSTPRDHLDIIGTLRMNDNDIYLRGNSGDTGHGLGWYGNGFGRQFKSTDFAEGPVLYGYSAGALGTSADTGNIALKWFSNRNVEVYGNLTKGGGSFKIDHPLEPREKYLYHSFVESPDMMNIYNGNVVTDGNGFATVEMPDWFEALNREFRYQLTVMGKDSWARARVYEEMVGNRFVIQTDIPDTRVSWQVTGIRRDAYAEKHRVKVEEDKPADKKGTCLHPEACE